MKIKDYIHQFQKESPFLKDMNSLIQVAKQMGLIEMSYFKHLTNATKCRTLNDVYESHAKLSHKVTVEVNDIFGTMILLGIGLTGALFILIAEEILKIRVRYAKVYLHQRLQLLQFWKQRMTTHKRKNITGGHEAW